MNTGTPAAGQGQAKNLVSILTSLATASRSFVGVTLAGTKTGPGLIQPLNYPITTAAPIPSGSQSMYYIYPLNPPCLFRICATFSTSGTLWIERANYQNETHPEAGGDTINEVLNSGTALVANAMYIFDISVDKGEYISANYSVNTTILKFSLSEINLQE